MTQSPLINIHIMTAKILLVLFYFLFPAFVVYLVGKYSLVRKIGAIVICYIAGLLLGNLNILPDRCVSSSGHHYIRYYSSGHTACYCFLKIFGNG